MACNVGRILRATNFFEMLRLPKPYADLLEQPVWDCTDDQVNRAYRKLSLCCHPDKSSHPDAPRAFEALKKAKACLTQPLDRDDYLREFVKKAKVAWEGNWSGADTVFAEKERMSTMREDAQATQRDSIAEAMRERRERVEKEKEKERRRAEARARREAREREGVGASDEGEESEGEGRAAPIRSAVKGAARKRPKFL